MKQFLLGYAAGLAAGAGSAVVNTPKMLANTVVQGLKTAKVILTTGWDVVTSIVYGNQEKMDQYKWLFTVGAVEALSNLNYQLKYTFDLIDEITDHYKKGYIVGFVVGTIVGSEIALSQAPNLMRFLIKSVKRGLLPTGKSLYETFKTDKNIVRKALADQFGTATADKMITDLEKEATSQQSFNTALNKLLDKHAAANAEAAEKIGKEFKSTRAAAEELNKLTLAQEKTAETLIQVLRNQGKDISNTQVQPDGTVLLLSRRLGPNQPIVAIDKNGKAKFGSATLSVDMTKPNAPVVAKDVTFNP